MELQDRFLSLDMTGDDVALLHRELGAIGERYELEVPAGEVAERRYGLGTRAAVLQFQEQNRARLAALTGAEGDGWAGVPGVVDSATAAAINQDHDRLPPTSAVSGLVRDDRGLPVKGARVQVFDQDMRSRQPLEFAATTDRTGRFRVEYTPADVAAADVGTADLGFEVTGALDQRRSLTGLLHVIDGHLVPVGEPWVLFNAPPQVEVVLTVENNPTLVLDEYTRLVAAIGSVTDVAPADLTPDDVTFLAAEFAAVDRNLDRDRIELLVEAENVRDQRRGVPNPRWIRQQPPGAARQQDLDVPAAAFYGIGHGPAGLPLLLPTLAVVPQDELRHRLRQAITDRIVPASLGEQIDDIVRAIGRLATSVLLQDTGVDGQASLGEVLSAAGVEGDRQDVVVGLFVAHDGTVEEFWSALREQPDIGDAVDDIQYALHLAWLVQRDSVVLDGLRERYPNARSIRELYQQLDPEVLEAIAAASDLPTIPDEGDTVSDLDTDDSPVPGSGPGDGPDPDIGDGHGDDELGDNTTPANDADRTGTDGVSRAKAFAQGVLDLLAASFPTDAFARVLPEVAGSFPDADAHAAVGRFFERAVPAGFDLRTSRIDDLVEAHPDVVGDGPEEERAAVVNQVKRVQRLFRLSVDTTSAAALLRTGLDSAHEIATVPPAAFLARFGESFANEEQATVVYERALTSAAATELLYTQTFQALNGARMMATDGHPEDYQEVILRTFPNLAELFGSLEMCECEDCRSVLSPAAYFVDLLEFLANSAPNPAGLTPFDVLVGNTAKGVKGRRPDLPHIPLTCENTNTKMPFVDLVNEILESYVVHGKLDASVAHDTGLATEPELSANPQHTDANAYDTLRDAVFPLSLPYDQAVDVLRVHLDHLGTSRADLLRTLDRHDGTLAPMAAQAAEDLGIFPNEFEVLTGNHFDGSGSTLVATIPAAYGLTPKDLAPSLALGATGPAVRALQRQLNAAGATPPLKVDGTFDALTRTALVAFQTGAGLPATGTTDAATWALLGAADPGTFESFVSHVPEFLRRTGIAYVDLIELLKTEYVNPGFPVLQFLEDHGIAYADVDDLAKTGFTTPNANIAKALLDPTLGMDQTQFIAWVQPRFADLGRFIVLRSAGAGCDLSETDIVRLDGDPVGEPAWYRLNRFIRLRRRLEASPGEASNQTRLPVAAQPHDSGATTASYPPESFGWPIRDVDRALSALGATDIDIALILSLRVTKRLMADLKLPLEPVLSFWAPIETQGPDSLFERLFRSRAMQKLDDSFALDPERRELAVAGQLSDHVPALLAALRVSEADLVLLREATGLADIGGVMAPMDLASLSVLHRHAALATGLRLTIAELLTLLDVIPFDPLMTSAFGPANTELFVDAALDVRRSRFSAGLLGYLLLGQDPTPAVFEPPADSVSTWLSRLRAGLTLLAAENEPGDDPHGVRTRERLGQLFEPAVADQAVRMTDGSAVYRAPLVGLPAGFAFPPALGRRVRHDATAGVLQLTGVMTVDERTDLKALSAGLAAPTKAAYEGAVDAIFAQPRAFVTDVLAAPGVFLSLPDAEANVFDTAATDEFGNPTWLDATGAVVALDADGEPVVAGGPPPVVTAVAAHFRRVLDRLLPFLHDRAARTLVGKAVAEALALEPGLARTLVEQDDVLHLDTPTAHPILDDLRALVGDGLTGTYFSAPLLTGATSTRVDPTIRFDYAAGSTVPGGATTPFSVRWNGFLLTTTGGVHTFFLRAGGNVKLTVDGVVVIDAWATPSDTELQGTISLAADRTYSVELDFSAPAFDGVIEWRWSHPAAAKAVVPQAQLYSNAAGASMDAPRQAYRLLHKVALLLNGFAVSDDEVRYLADHAADFDGFDLSALPLVPSPPDPTLFEHWSHLFHLAALRDELPTTDDGTGLATVLGAAADGPNPALLGTATIDAYRALTGVDLTEAAGALGLTDGDLRTEVGLGRVHALVQLARLVRVSPTTLADWVTTAAELGPADEIKRVLRARYDEATWPTVARPLNDVLRDHQRDALVAFLVPRLGLENTNQLYEHLLIDVDMGTCMTTSRIVQAIAAVQLFIQRSQLGVEDGVPPVLIDGRRYDWMSSYRLWEANRQVYLFPENWLEPALRDDKTPFFVELESDLLQSDLTTATAEDAYRNYLYKLDDVARLDLVGMCTQTRAEGNGVDDVVHLFGRTVHNPHQYFYRRRVNNLVWSPWERVLVDVEEVEKGEASGVDLIPIVWDRRLYLFWPQFTERTADDQDFTRTESDEHKAWRARHADWEKQMAWYQQELARWDADRKRWERENNVGGRSEFYPVPAPRRPEEPREPSDDTSIQRPRKFLDVSIAWSEYLGNGRWSPKQTTSESVRCNNLDRRSYIFQAVPLYDGTLSVSFLAHPVSDEHWVRNPKDPKRIQQVLVVDAGVDQGQFLFTGCQGDLETSLTYIGPLNGRMGVVMPDATEQDYMRFAQKAGPPGLVLNVGEYLPLNLRVIGDGLVAKLRKPAKLLNRTPTITAWDKRLSRFRLLYPHHLPQFVGQSAFCYQDDLRDYFVTPHLTSRIFERDAISVASALSGGVTRNVRTAIEAAAAGSTIRSGTGAADVDLSTIRSRTGAATPDLSITRPGAGPSGVGVSTIVSGAGAADPGESTIRSGSGPSAMLDNAGAIARHGDAWNTPAVQKLYDLRPRVRLGWLFEPLFHPYACTFVKTLRRGGIDALLSPDTQRLTDLRVVFGPGGIGGAPVPIGFTNNFETIYGPTENVERPYPMEDVDTSEAGSYSIYNWELFFHAVLLVAESLSRQQRFDEARRWFHFILDPMTKAGGAKPARYWNFLPFKEVESDRLSEMMLFLGMPDSALTAAQRTKKQAYAAQWQLLRDNPYRPYVVARLRPLAFMKNVAMRYIDNLIRWGDQLFAQDTRESINEATQLYVLASELCGPMVQKTPPRGRVAPETYDSLKKKQVGGKLDVFSNGLVLLEQEFPFSTGPATGASATGAPGPVLGNTQYFCIPQNRKLLGYWDTVGDRLFKIRNCLNIEGVERELPLFAPPIDPGLLVSAVAHGVDLKTVVNDLNTPAPHYRFTTVLQKALELCQDVKAFGAALLSALDKQDAEALARLRAGQEANMLGLVKEVRTQQLLEAQAAKGSLDRTAEVVAHRHEYYANLPDRIAHEATQLAELDIAQGLQRDGQASEQFASMIASYLPDTSVGSSGNGAHFTATFGRGNLIAQHQSEAHEKSFQAGQHTQASALASTLGTWMRRRTEWKYQAEAAEREMAQVAQQIETAKVRIAVTQRELLNHDQAAEDADRVEAFLREKFTDTDLYTWMWQQVANVYFRSYQIAVDLARKAEKAYRFELGLTTSNFVEYGYWDDMRKGLLAGERLQLALRQMERSYLDQNRRDYEITRHVSLLLHDPVALMELKQTGACEVELPESFFDADYPGHYLRRIKNASVTIPAVVGPYTSVNCTLTLLANRTRVKPIVGDAYSERLDADDDRFVSNFVSIQSVATSSAQNDSGLFELNFRDERYLPFEGAGAASRWRFELPPDTNAFDLDTVSDVVLHLRYTARDGGVMLRTAAREATAATRADTNDLAQARLVSLRHEFPQQWARFLAPTDATAATQELTIELPMERFPYRFRGSELHVREVEVLLPLRDFTDPTGGLPVDAVGEYKGKPLDVGLAFLAPNGTPTVTTTGTLDSTRSLLGGTPYLHWSVAPQDVPLRLRVSVTEAAVKALKPSLQTTPVPAGRKRLNPAAFDDIILILHYNAEP